MRHQLPGEPRKDYLLRVAASFIKENCPNTLVYFDEAECDGTCLAEDCLNAIDYPPPVGRA